MLTLHIIGPPVVEATAAVSSRGAALGHAAGAIEASGFFASLPALGVSVEGITHPLLPPGNETLDPVINLGHYNRLVAEAVCEAISRGAKPLLTGGSCNHLPGMLGGLQAAYGPAARIGLLWLDAHGDFNTPRTTHSGMLGGMPVAVAAGLCHPQWLELAGIESPLPTNRIVMVDVRNLDPEERQLIEATDVTIARFGPQWETAAIETAIAELAAEVDLIYVHVDSDILDASLQPNHPTAEPNGPDLPAVVRIIEAAMATGIVAAFAVVSINPEGPGGDISLTSGMEMIRAGVAAWSRPEGHV